MSSLYEFMLYIYKKGKEYKERLILPDGGVVELGFMGLSTAVTAALGFSKFNIGVFDNKLLQEEDIFNGILRMLVSNTYMNINQKIMEYADNELGTLRPSFFEVLIPYNADNTNLLFGCKPKTKDKFNNHLLGYYLEEILLAFKKSGYQIAETKNYSYLLANFIQEILVLKSAISIWLLVPSETKRKKPSERYCSLYDFLDDSMIIGNPLLLALWHLGNTNQGEYYPELQLVYATKTFRESSLQQAFTGFDTNKSVFRTRENPYTGNQIQESMKRKVFSKVYTSETGILPLVWAEILYYVENDLNIRICSECGRYFYIKANGKYCSDECKWIAKKKHDRKYYLEKTKAKPEK